MDTTAHVGVTMMMAGGVLGKASGELFLKVWHEACQLLPNII